MKYESLKYWDVREKISGEPVAKLDKKFSHNFWKEDLEHIR